MYGNLFFNYRFICKHSFLHEFVKIFYLFISQAVAINIFDKFNKIKFIYKKKGCIKFLYEKLAIGFLKFFNKLKQIKMKIALFIVMEILYQ